MNYLITPKQQLENLRKILLWAPAEDRANIISLIKKISDEINEKDFQKEMAKKGKEGLINHEND